MLHWQWFSSSGRYSAMEAFTYLKKGYRNGFVMKMLRGIGRLPGLHRWSQRMEDKYGEAIGNIDKQISQLRQQNKSVFRKSFFENGYNY